MLHDAHIFEGTRVIMCSRLMNFSSSSFMAIIISTIIMSFQLLPLWLNVLVYNIYIMLYMSGQLCICITILCSGLVHVIKEDCHSRGCGVATEVGGNTSSRIGHDALK